MGTTDCEKTFNILITNLALTNFYIPTSDGGNAYEEYHGEVLHKPESSKTKREKLRQSLQAIINKYNSEVRSIALDA